MLHSSSENISLHLRQDFEARTLQLALLKVAYQGKDAGCQELSKDRNFWSKALLQNQ